MADFLFGITFLDDFGVPRREDLVSKEAQHMVNNMLNTQDVNMLKTGCPFRDERELSVWEYQMKQVSAKITKLSV